MQKSTFLTLIISILFMGATCMAQQKSTNTPNYPYFSDLNYEQLVEVLKDKSLIVLDVRTAEEFKSGHLKGALSIDFRSPDFESKIKQLDKKKTYLLYCRSGNRSGQAMAVFKKNKFDKVYNQQGGIIELNSKKHPLVQEK